MHQASPYLRSRRLRLDGALVALATLVFGAQGCAFSNLSVSPPAPQLLAQPSSLGRGRAVFLATPLADQRPTPMRCGMQKNGYNMDTASVYCAMQPNQWMAQALAQGLYTAGFHVLTAPESRRQAPIVIDGDVLQFFVEPKVGFFSFSPEADISVKLVVTSPTGLRAERVFYVKGTEASIVGTEDNFEKAAESATKQAVIAMVSAIASLLDRYPQLANAQAAQPAAISLVSSQEMAQ